MKIIITLLGLLPALLMGQTLEITTLVAKGSVLVNEFGQSSDWLELKNTGTKSIDLGVTKYYISDNSRRKRKFKLPSMVLAPDESLIVFCDNEWVKRKQVHANFKLSSEGETILLSRKAGKKLELVDKITYSKAPENCQLALVKTKDGIKWLQLSE